MSETFLKEVAAGGIIAREGKLALVKVTNLQGEVRWTFPKGHLEAGEKPLAAALREVEEETGWRCENKGFFAEVRYQFKRNGRPVKKRVRWYKMTAVKRVARPDANEIMAVRWVALSEARKLLSYPKDCRLLRKLIARA